MEHVRIDQDRLEAAVRQRYLTMKQRGIKAGGACNNMDAMAGSCDWMPVGLMMGEDEAGWWSSC